MKVPHTFFVNVALLLSLIFVGSCPAQTAEQTPKTVYDYYMRLPNDYFEVPKASRKDLVSKASGGVVDLKNGYILAQGDGAQPSLEVAVFKRTSKADLIAVCHNEDDECVGFLYFYEHNPRFFGLVKCPNFLPAKFDAKYTYKLPRVGKTITVTNAAGKLVHSYSWNGTKFQ